MDKDNPAQTIVVGGGLAGIVAALELVRAGRPVLLLDRDREERFGGQALESFGGILAVDTPVQRCSGVRDSAELALADWLRFGELAPDGSWPYRWAQAYVRDCRREVYDWLRAFGLRFVPMPQWPERRGNSVPRWHIAWGTGRRLTLLLIGALRAAGGARLGLCFGQRVERLVLEQGRVVGVAGCAEDSGMPFEHRGAAVLIAAGGIAGDLDAVRAHWPPEAGRAPAVLLNGVHPFADGRLHRACAAAGARLGDMRWMWNYPAGVRHWRPRHPEHGLSLVPPRSALWLDARGERFEPPLLAGWDTSEQVARIAAAGGVSWQLLNRRIALRELAVSGAELNPAIRERRWLAFARDLLLGNGWLVDQLLANCPDVLAAPTLRGLVHLMNARQGEGVPLRLEAIERALADFERARVQADGLADAQWRNVRAARAWRGDRLRTARPGPLLDPRAGPLIAIREHIISRKSLGGIVTDLDGRVLDDADRPIAGLYAAGEASGFGGGGMNGRRALEGTFLGGCIYSARRAARAIGGSHP